VPRFGAKDRSALQSIVAAVSAGMLGIPEAGECLRFGELLFMKIKFHPQGATVTKSSNLRHRRSLASAKKSKKGIGS
jgi:hypothetical protein